MLVADAVQRSDDFGRQERLRPSLLTNSGHTL